MDKIRKLEAAWWLARNARLAALRQKREKHSDPHNPLQAIPGHEAKFENLTKLSQSMDVILETLEREIARSLGEAVKQKAFRLRDMAMIFGMTSLAALGVAAACITVKAPDPLTRASAVVGVALSLAWAVKNARK